MSELVLRPHRPGDLGWAVHRQAVLYHQEYGWTIAFEGLLAEIAAAFIRDFDPESECARIAERDGVILGAIFVVRADETTAKIRMLYVEPAARGQGVGRTLVEAAIAFARAAGYRRITLWTNDILTAARAIYEKAGFRLVSQEQHHSFGHDLVGENWELDLD
jgi:GNAT superfamily N-acetyltransferase